MPAPGSSSSREASQASRSAGDLMDTTESRSDDRSSDPRSTSGSPDRNPSCSVTSVTTRSFAVAVVASTGIPSGSSAIRFRSRR
jgi:hypothetical protein